MPPPKPNMSLNVYEDSSLYSQINKLAHQLWQEAGGPERHTDEFWFKAQSQLVPDVLLAIISEAGLNYRPGFQHIICTKDNKNIGTVRLDGTIASIKCEHCKIYNSHDNILLKACFTYDLNNQDDVCAMIHNLRMFASFLNRQSRV